MMTKEKNYFIREDGMIGYYSYYVQSLLDKIAELEKDFREYHEEFGGYYIKYSDMRTALNQALAKCFELQGQVEALDRVINTDILNEKQIDKITVKDTRTGTAIAVITNQEIITADDNFVVVLTPSYKD